ncbi:MAG: S8 family serine peptidase [Candidatus Alcyoniella australis]|nr:S8 family serine peptidase [Candidatus Alcyoniella australis]
MNSFVRAWLVAALMMVLCAGVAHAFSISGQDAHIWNYERFTYEPAQITFSQSLNPLTVNQNNIYITPLGDPSYKFACAYNLLSVNRSNDTVRLTPDPAFWFGVRLQIVIGDGLRDTGNGAFDGNFPWGDVFVANIPADFERPEYDPWNPFAQVVASYELIGYNPADPENTDPNDPADWTGISVTEAWKFSIGRPDVLIAVVDDGLEKYDHLELADNLFINSGELPEPQLGDGTPCGADDCNGDGKFNAQDYADDPRIEPGLSVDPGDLIDAFSDGVDDDQNGMVDDISGWDFFRWVPTALGVREFPEGDHGGDRAKDAAAIADNGYGGKPGVCPNCMILPIRVCDAVMAEHNQIAQGIEYARDMGADVVVAALGTSNFSGDAEERIRQAVADGVTIVTASGDELGFHHMYPGAGEDVMAVKAVYAFPNIPILGLLPFTETYCTNYGAKVFYTVSCNACSSGATGNLGGAAGLLISRARDLGIEINPYEIQQIFKMTADDIYERCITFTPGGCQPGVDEHFGYGRVNIGRAIKTLGDSLLDIPERIPPEVRITSPRWFTTHDPLQQRMLPIEADIFARGRSYTWSLQFAVGVQPLDEEFIEVATGAGQARTSGEIMQLDMLPIFSEAWLRKTPELPNDFTVTLRLRARYDEGGDTVFGEARKAIALRTDDDPTTGLLPGFPIYIGESGESSVALYDLDGDLEGRPEIIFGTSGGFVEVFSYDPETEAWGRMPGFPINVREFLDIPTDDVVIASVAVGDLWGIGMPVIVALCGGGFAMAIYPDGYDHPGGPLLPGFPVAADVPPNDTAYNFAHGRSFGASPVLADLDLDGRLEIIGANYDQKVYAWRSVDVDGDGQVDRMPGFPVLTRSNAEQVPDDLVCEGENPGEDPLPGQHLATPAVGVLDPDSANPALSQYPAIIVPTTEVCGDATGRIYGVAWDGENHVGGPFLPGWPAKIAAPLSGAVPVPPITLGLGSSPAMAMFEGKMHIGFGAFLFIPYMAIYDDGVLEISNLNSDVSFTAATHGSFAYSHYPDGHLRYYIPTVGLLQDSFGGLGVERFRVLGWDMDDAAFPSVQGDLEEWVFFINPVIADINGDGPTEVLVGSGGYMLHAFNEQGEPAGWPKFTHNWHIGSPAIGDIDADGLMEVVTMTHEGYLFAWNAPSPICRDNGLNSDWWCFHHDEHNSGVLGTDTIPPSRVTDLRVEELGDGLYELTWTAPGADWHCGVAAAYELRYAVDESTNVDDPTVYVSLPLVPGELTAPNPVGTAERITIYVPEAAAQFVLQSRDQAGNLALPSNSTLDPPPDDSGDDDDDDDSDEDQACCG